MILTHLVFFEFFEGAGDAGAPAPVVAGLPGKEESRRKRKRLIKELPKRFRKDGHLHQLIDKLVSEEAHENQALREDAEAVVSPFIVEAKTKPLERQWTYADRIDYAALRRNAQALLELYELEKRLRDEEDIAVILLLT